MPACSRCGKVNLKEALFCQECGQRLGGAEAAAEGPPPAAVEAPTCSRCGTVNAAGNAFCKMCGATLGAASPGPSPSPAVASGPTSQTIVAATANTVRLTCYSCGKQTPTGFAFCQHCGTRLATTAPVVAQAASPSVPALRAAASTPSPARPIERAPATASTVRADSRRTDAATVRADARATPSIAAPAPRAESRATGSRSDPRVAVPVGRLIFLRAGADAESQPIAGDTFDVGRTDGNLIIGTDPHLAPRHARFQMAGGSVKVRSLDATNGIFLKLREAHDLAPGDLILVGRQLLRFETLAPEERDPPSLVELGVRLIGSPSREAWGRLRQLTTAGTTRDVYHLVRPEMVLGRSEGDILFSDDDQASAKHAAFRRVGTRARLEDLGSQGGTFVRLRGERELKSGDVLRLGEQVLRFEAL